MGVLRLAVGAQQRLAPLLAERAYMVGLEGIPWAARVQLTRGLLAIERTVNDSGRVFVPWLIPGYGEQALSTASLMEREQPYALAVELARGKLAQVRQALFDWSSQGLAVPADVQVDVRLAIEQFSRAATRQHQGDLADEAANDAIATAHAAGEALVECFIEQALAIRQKQTPRLPTVLGAVVPLEAGDALLERYAQAFNSVVIPLTWRNVEPVESDYKWEAFDRLFAWAERAGLTVIAGPLLQFDEIGLPDWLFIWEGDVNNLASFATDFVERVTARYAGRVRLWQCAARVNTGKGLSLSDEQRYFLTARVLEANHAADPQAFKLVRFDQPWAEYVRNSDRALWPFHFADVMLRNRLPLSALGLDLNVGYHPGGSYARDRLELNRLVDVWTQLNLPLHVQLAVPSGGAADPKAQLQHAQPLSGEAAASWSEESQRQWIKRNVPLLLAKPAVASIAWNQLLDGTPHEFPHGGLFSPDHHSKRAFRTLGNLRRKYLN